MRRSQFSIRQSLAEQLRKVYVDHRARWAVTRKQKNTWSRTFDRIRKVKGVECTVWDLMADFFMRQQISDYVAYINLQFDSPQEGSHPPNPERMYGNKALSLWQLKHANRFDRVKEVRLSWQLQTSTLQTSIFDARESAKLTGQILDESELLRIALLDETVEMSALFRYCLAVEFQVKDAIDEYFSAAVPQYLFDRKVYDTAWGVKVPQDVRTEAHRQLNWPGSGGLTNGDQ